MLITDSDRCKILPELECNIYIRYSVCNCNLVFSAVRYSTNDRQQFFSKVRGRRRLKFTDGLSLLAGSLHLPCYCWLINSFQSSCTRGVSNYDVTELWLWLIK